MSIYRENYPPGSAMMQSGDASSPSNIQTESSNKDSREVEGSRDFGFLPIPKRLRYNSDQPFVFTTTLNICFGLGSTLTVMNIYYCQPLLLQFAQTFGVDDAEVSKIPTLLQAGYATGLLLISPLGDLVRRRPLLLLLVSVTGFLTIGLAVTSSLVVFETLSYLVGVVTVIPQILIPFAADLAPPERRASAISIVFSGLLFGVLLARVIAGIIAQSVTWRVVYYLAIGLQCFLLVAFYYILPDRPAKNKHMTYPRILLSMAKYAVTEPVLIQASLSQFASSACFAGFWVTLTFLLGGPPYNYSTLDIGLFGLIGMLGVSTGPFVGRFIDQLIPWYATLVATSMQLAFQAMQTGAGGINVAAVIIVCFGLDVGRQMQQVSLQTAVFGIEPEARSRLNAVLLICIFLGAVMGTSVGTHIFVKYGWRPAAAFNLGLFGWQLFILLLRGPHCERYTWIGWQGGLEPRKSVVEERKRRRQEEIELEQGETCRRESHTDNKVVQEDEEKCREGRAIQEDSKHVKGRDEDCTVAQDGMSVQIDSVDDKGGR